jgi:hypothetical protein
MNCIKSKINIVSSKDIDSYSCVSETGRIFTRIANCKTLKNWKKGSFVAERLIYPDIQRLPD